MSVRLITDYPIPGSRPRPPAMRRSYIYPHRSVRCWRPSWGRVTLALAIAAVLIAQVAFWNSEILELHHRASMALLGLSGIPVTDVRQVDLYPGLSLARVPDLPVPRLEARPVLCAISFGVGLFLLLLVHRLFPLARGFVLFLLTLLVVSAIVVAFLPSKQFGAAEFSQIWLRGEILVWFLLPVFSAGMVTVLHPIGVLGAIWAVLLEAYALAWSAVRLALILGIMHFSGILFVPLLWFAFGLLADMVYLMVFYSLAIHRIASKTWGRGAE